MIEYNWLATGICVAATIHPTLGRMSSHVPDDHLIVNHGARGESQTEDLCHGRHVFSSAHMVTVNVITGPSM